MTASSTPPQLPGYRCGDLLTRTATSTQWAARGPQQEPVIVRHRRLPALQARALEQHLDRLRGAPHPRCVRVHALARTPDGLLKVLDPPGGTDLATWLSTQGGLGPARLERVAGSLAAALVHLHGQGLRCGPLTPDRVILDASGAALLDVPESAPVGRTAADDVAGLAALLAGCGSTETSGTFEPDLDRDLAALLDAAATSRGAAPEISAQRVRDAATEAVRRREDLAHARGLAQDQTQTLADLAGAAVRAHVLAAPTQQEPQRRHRAVLVRAGALLLGVLLGLTGAAVAQEGSERPATTATPAAIPVAEAFRRRDAALMSGDLATLASAVAPGSPAWLHDVALLRSIARSGLTIRGLRTTAVATGQGIWVRQAQHVRMRGDLPVHVPAQPAYCVRIATDPTGRLAELARCESTPDGG